MDTKYAEKQPGTLLQKTCELIAEVDMLSISAETGLSYHWLMKVKGGNVSDPSVNKIQFLYEHLSKKKLFKTGV